MIDWTKSMKQNFEFYIVDPATWEDLKRIETITQFTINRESSNSTLGSATINCTEIMPECYIRAYLIADQNGITEKIPLGTYLVQTPSTDFDGKISTVSMDAYSPLVELKGTMPSIGYSLLRGEAIMDVASRLCRENMRAPVVPVKTNDQLNSDFVANLDDDWLTFTTDLIACAKYKFGLDEMSRVVFEPEQDMASLQSVWTYDDGNSSILYPDIGDERDLYGIPNVVEVVYSTNAGYKYARIVNDDINSPISTVNRGREVIYRENDPNFSGMPTQEYIEEYATYLLRSLSCLEHKITYTHGYCPVRLGDCVTLNYQRAGLINVKAKVISQSISCETGCPVEETAVYTTKLWR